MYHLIRFETLCVKLLLNSIKSINPGVECYLYVDDSYIHYRSKHKLTTLDNNRLLKHVFNFDFDNHTYKNNWCTDVKSILFNIGLSNCFTNEVPVELHLARTGINDKYKQIYHVETAN